MNEQSIREAFQKAKEDIFYLGNELQSLKQDIVDLTTEIKLISSYINDIKIHEFQQIDKNTQFQHINQQTDQQTDTPTGNFEVFPTQNPTIQHISQAQTPPPTDTPTLPQETGGLISPYKALSTGNRGVPTDKPTDRQTNQQTHSSSIKSPPVSLDRAQELLASLDSLKKEVRFKFKRLTSQEMHVFSLLYNLEESGIIVDYKILADKLKLSESSVRDYTGKIQKKGIPIIKEKLNNKRVILHISPDLKQIASLQTILKLREI
ncbi:MAG: hypothetical protein KKB21_00045 [Nanoarchaeota archaeon]|nr:hypothetical protein [Nanoarchaeota archaeon]